MVQISKTPIEGAWELSTPVWRDERGCFREWFSSELLENAGLPVFKGAQCNVSESKLGVIRGIHFSLAPEGQHKVVTCLQGAILDVVIDIRPDSNTFLNWFAVNLYPDLGKSVFISSGLGHAFAALESGTLVAYTTSSKYNSELEFTINPFDSEIAIKWPEIPHLVSERDSKAPGLLEFFNQKRI